MTKQVTKRQAEAVRKAVAKMFAAEEGYGPKLRDRRDYDGQPGWQIYWEEGPFEWTYRFPDGGFDEELYSLAEEFGTENARRIANRPAVTLPAGVYVEAINHWSIALYREE